MAPSVFWICTNCSAMPARLAPTKAVSNMKLNNSPIAMLPSCTMPKPMNINHTMAPNKQTIMKELNAPRQYPLLMLSFIK